VTPPLLPAPDSIILMIACLFTILGNRDDHGYKLANDGHQTRSLQAYLGHKNIQHTVRYTEIVADAI